MVRKSYTPEQILNKLREAEILLNQGTTLPVVWKKIGVSDCTYYRWRKEYGGMRIEQAKRLKELEQENSHFKRSVIGSYHKLSTKHLDAYLDELEWRFNNRDNPYLFRDTLLKLINSDNLPYEKLIS